MLCVSSARASAMCFEDPVGTYHSYIYSLFVARVSVFPRLNEVPKNTIGDVSCPISSVYGFQSWTGCLCHGCACPYVVGQIACHCDCASVPDDGCRDDDYQQHCAGLVDADTMEL